MKTTKMLTVLVLASAIMVWTAEVSEAAAMGTAFTYQGHLYDNNDVADGLYDFQFALFDDSNDPCSGNQLGGDVNQPDVDVIDGYFTVELDFGSSVFDGNAVWLDIGVRPGELSDPNAYSPLSPRQEITPTPYALHTRWLLVDTALDNVFAGEGAGASNTTGYDNSAMGYYALYSNTTGRWNSAVGRDALYSNTTGYSNSAMGNSALRFNTEGVYNSAMGLSALRSNTTGYENSAMGVGALRSNTTGNYNSAVGREAGRNNSTGSGNVFLGYKAGYNETGDNKLYIANSDVDPPLIYGDFSTGNVGIGTTSPTAKLHIGGTAGVDGIKFPDGTLQTTAAAGGGGDDLGNHIATQNIELNGNWLSGDGGTEGVYVNNAGNVGIGTPSPSEVLDVNGNININSVYKIGGATVLSNTGTNNIFAGEGAGASITTGNNNSAMGIQALYWNTTGNYNSAMGYMALYFNTASYNTAMGNRALYWNTTGGGNSAMGYSALNRNTNGNSNSAMGDQALYFNTTGSDNSAMGRYALLSNTTGNNNSAVGYQAGYSNSTGSGNVFLGNEAGYNETGDNKLYIANDSADANVLIYGDFSTGRVGIGTTSPNEKLTVEGAVSLDEMSAPSATSGYGKIYIKSADSKLYFKDDSGSEYDLTAAGGGGDDLGNHIATQSIELNGNWLSGDGGNEGVFVNNAGNVGIGTTSPDFRLDVEGGVRFWNSTGGRSGVQIGTIVGSGTAIEGIASDGNLTMPIYINYDSSGKVILAYGGGNVGIGTTSPQNELDVEGAVAVGASYSGTNTGPTNGMIVEGNVGIGTTSPTWKLEVAGTIYGESDSYIGVYGKSSSGNPGVLGQHTNTGDYGALGSVGPNAGVYGSSASNYAGYFFGKSYFSGNVGIGTTDPNGKLDVNGSIYQRGSSLHADYVFEPGYQLESIDEHSEFMWANKHLAAIPEAETDEAGQQIVEVGAHRKGIVEELEKAHIYIEQLHKQNKALEARLAAVEAVVGKLSVWQEGGQR